MQLLTAQDPDRAACPSSNRTSRFIVMELEQAIDKAVEAVGLQSLKPLKCHVTSSFVTGNDVFVCLLASHAASYYYLLCARGSIVLCISSLMLEEREKYSTKGI